MKSRPSIRARFTVPAAPRAVGAAPLAGPLRSFASGSRTRFFLPAFLAGAALAFCAGPGFAATQNFNGSTSSDIEASANYDAGSTVPANDILTDILSIDGTVAFQPKMSISRSLLGLVFAGTNGGFSLTSTTTTARVLTLGASGVTANNTSGTDTIGLSTNQVSITLGANSTFTTTSGGTLSIATGITGASFSLTVTGGGTLALNNASTFNALNVQSGTVTGGSGTSSATEFGTGTITLGVANSTNSATLQDAGSTTHTNAIALAGGDTGTLTIGTVGGTNGPTFSGGVTGNANLTLANAGSGTLTFSTTTINNVGTVINKGTGGGTTVISAAIGANVTAITENGTSPLTLSGTNTNFAGSVNLTAGTLTLTSATALGGNGSTTGTGGALNISAGTTLAGSTTITTVNAININGDFTYGGTGSLGLGTGAVSLGSGAGTSRTITFASTGTLAFAGVVSDGTTATNLIKAGAGTLNLSNNANTFSNLTVNGGTVAAVAAPAVNGSQNAPNAAGTAFGAGDITLNGGGLVLSFGLPASNPTYVALPNNIVLTSTSTLQVDGLNGSGSTKRNGLVTGLISGSGQLNLTGLFNSATYLSHASNTYTGGTLLNTVDSTAADSVQYVAAATNALGGGDGTGGSSGTGGVVTFDNLSGTATQATAILVLQANQTIAGLQTSTANPVGATRVTGFSTTTPVTLTINNTLNGTGSGSNYAGSIGGTPLAFGNTVAAGGNNIGLVKSGTGTQTFSGLSSYTGTTIVNGGTLGLSGTGANSGTAISAGTLGGATAITVNNSGSTLALNANYTISSANSISLGGGTVNVASGVLQGQGTTLNGGASGTSITGIGMLTLTANSTLAFVGGSGTVVFSGFNPSASNFVLAVTGTTFGNSTASADGANDRLIFATSQAGNLNDFSFNGVAGATQVDLGNGYFEIQPAAVPEPRTAAAALCLLGFSGLIAYRRRRAA